MVNRVYKLAKSFHKRYFGTIAFRLKAHSKVIEEHLNPGEKLLYVFCGQKGYSHKEIFSTCVLAITDNPNEVIEKINNAGGIAVLAHPCCYWTFNLDGFIEDMARMGISGVEVYYPYNGMRSIVKFHSRKKIADIADKYGLIKTGGTDSHGRKLL